MRVLIADDDPVWSHITGRTVKKWGYDVELARDGIEAWTILERHDAPQLAVVNWMMPNLDGIDLCRRVRARTHGPYTFIILLTARDHRDDMIQGMAAGADDYISKPFNPAELRVRLKAGERVVDLQTSLVNAQALLRVQASHDPLTGVWNRAAIFEKIDQELLRARRERSEVSVLMADLDHFKQINDQHGHLVGDVVLREITRRMTACVRSYDGIGRFGGEEFLIALPGVDARIAALAAERIRSKVASDPIPTLAGFLDASVSIGVAASGGLDVGSQALVHAADLALYRAKRAGRNRVEAATTEDVADAPKGGERE